MSILSLFLTTLSTRVATISTIIIVMIVIGVFIAHYYFIESHKEDIKSKYIVSIYIVLFLILGAAIFGILSVWGYDVSDYLIALADGVTVTLEGSVPKIVGTLVSVLLGMMFYKISKISLFRLGRKPSNNQRRKITIAKISLSVVKYLIVIITFLVVLSIWGVNVAPALAGLGILGLVVGLGASKFINDLISGFFIIFEHHFDVGDWVEIGGFMGEVVDIGLKTTKVKNFKGELRIFNNGSIDPVSNFSRFESLAIVEFGIAYKEDIAKSIEILSKELPAMQNEHPNMLEGPRILGVTELANSSVNLRAVCKVKSMTQWAIERAMRQRIKEILVQYGIEIPFPQIVLHNSVKESK
jgi:moderate conductance mechanosensitive channel